MPTVIHPTALIEPGAQLGENVTVGAFAYIGGQAVIGDGCAIQHHATVENLTILGRDNILHPYAFIGGMTQDKKFEGGAPGLRVGDRNIFREYVSVHIATKPGDFTVVGSDNFLLAYSHIAHECQVGNHNILSSHSALGGHVHIGDNVNVGWNAGIHQFCQIGAHAMTGFQSHVSQDVPPYMMVSGNPLGVHGFNVEGLRRRGFSRERIALVKQMHRLLYRDGLTLDAAKAAIAALQGTVDGGDADVTLLLDFLAASTRGIAR